MSTIDCLINVNYYCPVYKKNEFYNFKERLFVQIDNIDAKVLTHDKYGDSMVIKDDNFNKFIFSTIRRRT